MRGKSPRGSLTRGEGGAYHFDVAAFPTPAALLCWVTARRLTSLHKPRLGHRKEFYRLKEVISRRPSTMFPDHDNPATAAAAAPAQDSETENEKNDGNPANAGASEVVAEVNAAKDEGTAGPVPQADGDVRLKDAAAPAPQAVAQESHGKEAAAPVDAEAAAAAEEAAGSEEMSKLMEQYGEPTETASQNEIIEVKVVAYTEQGVVVDLGQKTERLIPPSAFSQTATPRPEPNATIEVQRTGETKESYIIASYH